MTHSGNAEINLDQLTGIASFMVAADEQLTITWASELVLRRAENALGLKVSDIVEPTESPEEISPSSIARNMGRQQRFFLKSEGCTTPLIGRWIPSRYGFILLASPDVRKQEDLDKFSFDDFPENDFTIELLTAREEHITSLKEAKSAANALRKREQYYRSIMETALDGFWINDEKGRIVEVNASYCRMVGYTREELLKMSIHDVEAVEDPKETATHIRHILEHGYDRFTARHRCKDGNIIDVEVSATYTEKGSGQLVVSLHDITERKNKEKERQKHEMEINQARKLEAVGSLASGIAHEINTPVQFVGDNTNFLFDSFKTILSLIETYDNLWQKVNAGADLARLNSERVKAEEHADLKYLREEIPSAIKETLDGVQRVTKIVRAMKDFAHSDQGEKSVSDINDMLLSCLTVSRNELKYVADVETNFDRELPDIECYRDDMNQVFLNLLVNAAHTIADVVGDASAGKGIITVSTLRDNDMVIIKISDTGKGISRSIQDRIFDPFFSTKDVGKGSGQGLSIARRIIVEKHEGNLDFETEEGKGTTFIIRLPIKIHEKIVEVT